MKAVIGSYYITDRGEVCVGCSEEFSPGRRIVHLILHLVVGSPPSGSIIFHEGGSQLDVFMLRDVSKFHELLDLEDPGFKVFSPFSPIGFGLVGLDSRGVDCCKLSLLLVNQVLLGLDLLSEEV